MGLLTDTTFALTEAIAELNRVAPGSPIVTNMLEPARAKAQGVLDAAAARAAARAAAAAATDDDADGEEDTA